MTKEEKNLLEALEVLCEKTFNKEERRFYLDAISLVCATKYDSIVRQNQKVRELKELLEKL